MPKRTFEDIPNEIILNIVQDAIIQLPEQLSLSRTSRRLRSIAELSLYHSVTLDDMYPGPRKTQKFVRTIVSRPELGAITRCLDLWWFDWCDNDDCEFVYTHEEREFIILPKLACEKGMSARAVSELKKGWFRPHVSLLVHLLPKLESLKVRNMDKGNAIWTLGKGEYNGPAPVGLQFISSLEMFVESWDYRRAWATEDVVPFMSLPALNSFRVHYFEEEGNIHWDEGDAKASEDSKDKQEDIFRSSRYVKRSSKLKELCFYRSLIQSSMLEDILQIPEALDIFIYECDAYDIGAHETEWCSFDVGRLTIALHHHANSLTILSLILIDSVAHMISPGSFRDFPLLKELTISCSLLLGLPLSHVPRGCTAFFDLLPSNLMSLTIEIALLHFSPCEGCWEVREFLDAIQDDGQVSRWRRVRGQHVPHLETFSLWTWENPPNAREELEALGITIDPRSSCLHADPSELSD